MATSLLTKEIVASFCHKDHNPQKKNQTPNIEQYPDMTSYNIQHFCAHVKYRSIKQLE